MTASASEPKSAPHLCSHFPPSVLDLVRHDAHMIIANLGDCRAVLCRGGKAVRLSEDHKPSRPGVFLSQHEAWDRSMRIEDNLSTIQDGGLPAG